MEILLYLINGELLWKKKPYIAALISAIYPGLGIIYAGNKKLGIFLVALTTVEIIYLVLVIFLRSKGGYIYPHYYHLLYWILVVIGSYRIAQIENAKLEEKEGKVGIIDEKLFICPKCMAENVKGAEECTNCGKNLREVLLYSNGSAGHLDYPDVEINQRNIVEYKKGITGKRNGKSEKFMLNMFKML